MQLVKDLIRKVRWTFMHTYIPLYALFTGRRVDIWVKNHEHTGIWLLSSVILEVHVRYPGKFIKKEAIRTAVILNGEDLVRLCIKEANDWLCRLELTDTAAFIHLEDNRTLVLIAKR